MFRRLAFLSALLVSSVTISGSAWAADIAVEPEPLAPTWTGFHIGIGGGYGSVLHEGFLEVEGVVEEDDDEDDFENLLEFDDLGDDSWLATIEAGYDFQMGERFVLGIFGDYTLTDFDATVSDLVCNDDADVDCIGTQINVETDQIWTVGGRLGLLSSESTLWYALGGYSNARIDVNGDVAASEEDDDPLDVLNFLNKDDRVGGFTVGAGVESMLSENVSLKLEYRYSNFKNFKKKFDCDSDDCIASDFPGGADHIEEIEVDEFKTKFDTTMQSIRAVLSFRF